MLNLEQRRTTAAHQALTPSASVITIGLLSSRIGAVEWVREGTGKGGIGHAEHRLLEAHTNLHVSIDLAPTMAVVLAAQLLGQVAEHV